MASNRKLLKTHHTHSPSKQVVYRFVEDNNEKIYPVSSAFFKDDINNIPDIVVIETKKGKQEENVEKPCLVSKDKDLNENQKKIDENSKKNSVSFFPSKVTTVEIPERKGPFCKCTIF